MKINIKIVALAAILLASCGGKKETKPTIEKPVETPKEVIQEKTSSDAYLTITSNDQMQYDTKELKVKEGQRVTLTLKHTGQMPKVAMGHNWVLLQKGTDIGAFTEKAGIASENDYIANEEQIIAHTKVIGGGESTTITFDAPAKGTYDFICSFPGHYGLMQGKFIVE